MVLENQYFVYEKSTSKSSATTHTPNTYMCYCKTKRKQKINFFSKTVQYHIHIVKEIAAAKIFISSWDKSLHILQ